VKGHASLGARWNARALASAASPRSARHMGMFVAVCVSFWLACTACF
jgi:hypothetical protein